jgi:hypothetical protein
MMMMMMMPTAFVVDRLSARPDATHATIPTMGTLTRRCGWITARRATTWLRRKVMSLFFKFQFGFTICLALIVVVVVVVVGIRTRARSSTHG